MLILPLLLLSGPVAASATKNILFTRSLDCDHYPRSSHGNGASAQCTKTELILDAFPTTATTIIWSPVDRQSSRAALPMPESDASKHNLSRRGEITCEDQCHGTPQQRELCITATCQFNPMLNNLYNLQATIGIPRSAILNTNSSISQQEHYFSLYPIELRLWEGDYCFSCPIAPKKDAPVSVFKNPILEIDETRAVVVCPKPAEHPLMQPESKNWQTFEECEILGRELMTYFEGIRGKGLRLAVESERMEQARAMAQEVYENHPTEVEMTSTTQLVTVISIQTVTQTEAQASTSSLESSTETSKTRKMRTGFRRPIKPTKPMKPGRMMPTDSITDESN